VNFIDFFDGIGFAPHPPAMNQNQPVKATRHKRAAFFTGYIITLQVKIK
jgi:hypothetical protein